MRGSNCATPNSTSRSAPSRRQSPGTVGLIQAAPGNQIGAQTVLTTIEDSSEILINFWVPERYAGQIAQGMTVTAGSVAIAGLAIRGHGHRHRQPHRPGEPHAPGAGKPAQ